MAVSYPWPHGWYCEAVRAEIERFATATRASPPDAKVPTCPGWDMAKLIRHAGSVHRWAAAMVQDLAPRRYETRRLDLALPADPRSYPDWLAAGADPLVDALRSRDPDARMWAWGADQRVRFWSRRMLHETTVHHADAEFARGGEPHIDPDVAVDGVDEFLVNVRHAAYFAPKVENLRGDGEALALRAVDRPAAWRITLGGEGFAWERAGEVADADAVVSASAADLYLFVWGRRGFGEEPYTVAGDTGLLEFWAANAAI